MSVTPIDLFERAARILGGQTGFMGTVAVDATNTTVVLSGLTNTTGNPQSYANWLLFYTGTDGVLYDALVSLWADSTGTATFLNGAIPPDSGERYILVSATDYNLGEYRAALGKALNETPRTYRWVEPLTPLLNRYPLDRLDWLTGAGDVDQVYLTLSPLMLHNEDVSLWQDGRTSAPDGFTLEGAGATVTRVSGGTRSNYAAQVTAGGDAPARLVQAIPESLSQWITRRTFPVYIPLRGAAWGKTTDASSVRVFIRYTDSPSGSPVTTYAYSEYMTADGRPQFPSLSLTPNANLDHFEWGIEALASKTVTLSWAGLMQNTLDFPNSFGIRDSGSQAFPYAETPVNKRIRNVGGIPIVELPPPVPTTWGQLVVYVRRPFPEYSSDEDEYLDQYARVLTAGLLVFLLQADKPQQERGRIDRIREQQQRIWKRMSLNVVDLPIPDPPIQQNIVGS